MKHILLILFALFLIFTETVQAQDLARTTDYLVLLDGKSQSTLRCEVNPYQKLQIATWSEFEVTKHACVRIIKRGEKIISAIVRPLSKGIKHTQLNDSTIEFVVPTAGQIHCGSYSLSVEFNGDREHNLHLFIDAPLTKTYYAPSLNSQDSINWTGEEAHDVFTQNAKFIYFGPGEHKPKDLPSKEIKIPSNTTVYLAPGAIIKARLIVDHAENVRIIGRGIIDHPLRGVEITFSKNVLIDGLTIINPEHYTIFGGQSENITIRNLRSFSRHPWSDGIDLMCCKNVTVEDVFLRTGDDCFALYNHRWWYWGGSENFHVRRATVFPDVAHPFNFGTHGDDRASEGETLRGVWIEDCDVLSANTDAIFAIRCGDQNKLEDIHFQNIRIEDVIRASLFNVQTNFSTKYNRAPGACIRDVWFKNIYFTGDVCHLNNNIFRSYDATHPVSDLHFENIRINGKEQKINSKIDNK